MMYAANICDDGIFYGVIIVDGNERKKKTLGSYWNDPEMLPEVTILHRNLWKMYILHDHR